MDIAKRMNLIDNYVSNYKNTSNKSNNPNPEKPIIIFHR